MHSYYIVFRGVQGLNMLYIDFFINGIQMHFLCRVTTMQKG